jgi:hypothetical protein
MTANQPCQANGCYGGYYCDMATNGCHKLGSTQCP